MGGERGRRGKQLHVLAPGGAGPARPSSPPEPRSAAAERSNWHDRVARRGRRARDRSAVALRRRGRVRHCRRPKRRGGSGACPAHPSVRDHPRHPSAGARRLGVPGQGEGGSRARGRAGDHRLDGRRADKGLALGAADYLVKPVPAGNCSRRLPGDSPCRPTGRCLRSTTIRWHSSFVGAVLEPVGYTVLTARSGEEGVALARSELPDVVLLDLVMPEVDGFTVVEQLKDDPVTRSIPIVILTSKTLTPEDEELLQRTDRPSRPEGRVRSIRTPRADPQVHDYADTLSGTTTARADPDRRGQRAEPRARPRPPSVQRIRDDRGPQRRGRRRARRRAPARSHSHGHPAPRRRRRRGSGRLRADVRTASIGVVALTAFAMTDDRQRLLDAGFDGYLEKPIDVRAFPGQVLALLQSTRREAIE